MTPRTKNPPPAKKSKSAIPFPMPLIPLNQLTKLDILLGRGKERFKQMGNIAYRAFISSRRGWYYSLDRTGKSRMVLEIVDEIQGNGGRFLKNMGNFLSQGPVFQEVPLQVAREKVGHSIRDGVKAMHSYPFEVEMNDIFDEQCSFGDIFSYVIGNYETIVKQLRQQEGNAQRYYSKKSQQVCSYDEEDRVPETISEPDNVSSTGTKTISSDSSCRRNTSFRKPANSPPKGRNQVMQKSKLRQTEANPLLQSPAISVGAEMNTKVPQLMADAFSAPALLIYIE